MTDQLNIESVFTEDVPLKYSSLKNRCVKCSTEWYDFTLPKCKKCDTVFKYDDTYKISTDACGHVRKESDCRNVNAMAFANTKHDIIVKKEPITASNNNWFKKLFCCCFSGSSSAGQREKKE
jgi:hypothetical protein